MATPSETQNEMNTLNAALQQFEATEANLAKLEDLWKRIENLLPTGPAFGGPPEYEELCWAFRRILPSMPAIDGFRIEDHLHDYDSVGQMRLDALEIGEIEAQVSVTNTLEEQGRQLREYRFRIQAQRRQLVRERLLKLMNEIDQFLSDLNSEFAGLKSSTLITAPLWCRLRESVSEIDTLLGATARPPRWSDLQRHLHFSMVNDLTDIIRFDWPAVSKPLREQLYGDHDPVPVAAEDLREIVSSRPAGSATTQLNWNVLDDKDFERLVFQLIIDEPSYENPLWLQKTDAPDRGRDLSVDRVESSILGGVRRYRTIIQCKHWLSKSVGPDEISRVRDQMALWEPPRVDELVIVTSGRFTSDAVLLVEKHNQSNNALNIAMWPDSHLESILAARPDLIGQFRLRRGV